MYTEHNANALYTEHNANALYTEHDGNTCEASANCDYPHQFWKGDGLEESGLKNGCNCTWHNKDEYHVQISELCITGASQLKLG